MPPATARPRPTAVARRGASGRRGVQLAGARRGAALAVSALALGAALAGCGSSHSAGTQADPATAVPASAKIFADATVRPSGALAASALAAGSELTHQSDPYTRLVGVLETPGSPKLSYQREVAPWLGPRAGLFLTSLGASAKILSALDQDLVRGSSSSSFPFGDSGGAQGALVLDTSNVAKARSFLEAQAAHAGAHRTSYRGVSYELTAGGVALGVVHDFAVIGSEEGLHEVVDTVDGGPALASAGDYAKLATGAPSGAIGHLYVAASGASAGQLPGVFSLLAGQHSVNISVVLSASSLQLDADTLGEGESAGLLSADPEAAQALDALPGESWLALGLGHVGTNLAADVSALEGLPSVASALGGGQSGAGSTTGTLDVKSLLEAMVAPLAALGSSSAQARKDFASWMGSAGVFASGSNLLELKAAIVIASNDPALSRAAVSELGKALARSGGKVQAAKIPGTEAAVAARLTGLPVILDIADGRAADGQTKFVLGFGEASVQDALNPSSTMGAAATRTAAAAALGEGIQPSVMLDTPTLLTLLEGVGLLEDPMIAKVVPYLRSVTEIAGGGHSLGGEVDRFRLTVGLAHGGGEG